jgi:endonuclease/exonuclease/phosphatase family metal-dependent hydrolase
MRWRHRASSWLLTFATALAASSSVGPREAAAQAGAPAAAQGQVATRPIRVLFFNTHLLPGIAQFVAGHRGQDDYRAQAIAAALPAYDLIGLCEVFEAKRRRQIVDAAQEASGGAFHWVESPSAGGRALTSGGLLLLSRFPIEGEVHVLTYQSASRVWTSGPKADGLAAKGVIHARLALSVEPPVLADCFLTHLESISPTARAAQIAELAGFIVKHGSTQRPLILMGDLNVFADDPTAPPLGETEYQQLRAALIIGGQPLVDAWPLLQGGRGGTRDALAREACPRIDYVFLSPPRLELGVDAWAPQSIRVEPFLDAKVDEGSLSDHAGVACELLIQSPRLR